jgi:hypothetical protein
MPVHKWLRDKFDILEMNRGFPDIIAYKRGLKYGFEIGFSAHASKEFIYRLESAIYRSNRALQDENFSEIWVILVVSDSERVRKLVSMAQDNHMLYAGRNAGRNIRVVIGTLKADDVGREENVFMPYEEIIL